MKLATYGSVFGDAWLDEPLVDHPRAGRLDRAARLAHAALARLSLVALPGLGVFIGSEWGSFAANVEHADALFSRGPSHVSPLTFPATVPSAVTAELAMTLGVNGPQVTVVAPVSQLVDRLLATVRASLQAGDCEQALVGVVEAWHPRMAALGLQRDSVDGAVLAWGEPSAWLVARPSVASRATIGLLKSCQ